MENKLIVSTNGASHYIKENFQQFQDSLEAGKGGMVVLTWVKATCLEDFEENGLIWAFPFEEFKEVEEQKVLTKKELKTEQKKRIAEAKKLEKLSK